MSFLNTIEYVRNLSGTSATIGETETVTHRWLVKLYPGPNQSNRRLAKSLVLLHARQWQQFNVANPLIPTYFETYFDGQSLTCRQLNATQENQSPLHYIVEATYDDSPIGIEAYHRGTIQDPNERPWRWTSETETQRIPITRDIDGKLITNSARDPFDPPYEDDVYTTVFVGRSFSSLADIYEEYRGYVNSDVWSPRGDLCFPHQLKITGISVGEEVDDGGRKVNPVTVTIKKASVPGPGTIDAQGNWVPGRPTWDVYLLDQGVREGFINSNNEQIPGVALGVFVQRPIKIRNEEGQLENATEPVLLNGNGRVLSHNGNFNDRDIVWLNPPLVKEVNFQGLFS